jgi:osmotically-inducible protein OsmY
MKKRLFALSLAALAAGPLTACFPLVAAGVGTGVVVAQDRRPTAVLWNDQQIENRVASAIHARFGTLTHVNVTSYNRAVLLTGEVPDEVTRAEVERLARETQDVARVYNELAVRLPSSLSSRAADSTLTTRVKARMVDANKFSPIHVKVVTERNVVYLMGQVTRQEAQDAAQIASLTSGVERVVTYFEYLD